MNEGCELRKKNGFVAVDYKSDVIFNADLLVWTDVEEGFLAHLYGV
jgi:hypothetical protein